MLLSILAKHVKRPGWLINVCCSHAAQRADIEKRQQMWHEIVSVDKPLFNKKMAKSTLKALRDEHGVGMEDGHGQIDAVGRPA